MIRKDYRKRFSHVWFNMDPTTTTRRYPDIMPFQQLKAYLIMKVLCSLLPVAEQSLQFFFLARRLCRLLQDLILQRYSHARVRWRGWIPIVAFPWRGWIPIAAGESREIKTLDSQNLEYHCPLDNGRHSFEITSQDLGALSAIPTELLWSITKHLDIPSLTAFRRVSKYARNVVDESIEYQCTMIHAPQM